MNTDPSPGLSYEAGYDLTKPIRPMVRSANGVVASGHMLASLAGLDILRRGGNAVDAGIAAGVVLNVVHSDMTSFSGVAPIILYLAAERRVVTISGLGRWPKAASLAWFWENAEGRFQEGVQHSVVPAAADAWATALARFGTMTLAEVFEPAIRHAEEGFPVHALLAHHLGSYWEHISARPTTAATLASDGRPPREGEILRLPELAATLRRMAEQGTSHADRVQGIEAGRDLFYRGEIARRFVDFSEANGGFFTLEDFADFQVGVEPSVSYSFMGHEVHACGAWCQGPVLLQALAILAQGDLRSLGHNSAAYIHRVTEALNLAFADREHYYGDPQLRDVPIQRMLEPGYAAARAALIRPGVASTEMLPPGDAYADTGVLAGHHWDLPRRWGSSVPGQPSAAPEIDTSYVSVADRDGNLFSATPSGSSMTPLASPVVPGVGLPLDSRGTQSRLDATHPAAVAPWSRPRLTPSPALVLRDGLPLFAIGSPGGDVQPQAMLQVLLNVLVFGMDWQAAVEAPRFSTFNFPNSFYPYVYEPGLLYVEATVAPEVRAELRGYGYRLEEWPLRAFEAGSVCLSGVHDQTGLRTGAVDIRREAVALGW